MSWREKYPELETLLDTEVAPVVDPYGQTYLSHIDYAEMEYGLEGVAMQLPYIANNLLPGNSHLSDRLNGFSRKIKEDIKRERERPSSSS